MEESIKYLKEQFDLQPVDIRTYSPVVLAYIGDAVYELVIRTILVDQGNRQANTLHKKASTYVKASAQAAMAEAFLPELTEEELHLAAGYLLEPEEKERRLTRYQRRSAWQNMRPCMITAMRRVLRR